MTILINIIVIGLILFTYWFFFMKNESKAVSAGDEINIVVEGGYNPNIIKVKKNKPTTLIFYRKDASSCLEEVVLPDFNIREHLILNKPVNIVINPTKTGIFEFSCGMNMFHGKIIVEE